MFSLDKTMNKCNTKNSSFFGTKYFVLGHFITNLFEFFPLRIDIILIEYNISGENEYRMCH